MMILLTVLSLASLVSGNPDHHGDGHEDNCVDISKYSDILYEENTHDLCTYVVTSVCSTAISTACVSIPTETCTVVGYPNCKTETFTQVVHDDRGEPQQFGPKKCYQSGEEELIEIHKTPVCENVTKEQCDSIWEINELGEKVWAGNDNCQTVTWEDCKLVDVPNPILVPTYTCDDDTPIPYEVPNIKKVEVTGHRTRCAPSAYKVCETTYENACTEAEVEQCSDVIEPSCFGQAFFKVPYQTYDHRLKCIVADHA